MHDLLETLPAPEILTYIALGQGLVNLVCFRSFLILTYIALSKGLVNLVCFKRFLRLLNSIHFLSLTASLQEEMFQFPRNSCTTVSDAERLRAEATTKGGKMMQGSES